MSDTTGTQGADPTGTDELASAYLDGEATPDERAQVEASAELLDEVERLRQVRAVLGATTEPPPISVREAHLAAALDVWDRMPETERSGEATPSAGMDAAAAAAITTPAPTSLSSRRERRSGGSSGRWLLGAAAGLVAIAGVGIVIQGIGSGSDDEGDSDFAADAPAEESASEAAEVAGDAADEFIGIESESAPLAVNDDDVESEDGRSAAEPAEAPAEEAMEDEAPAEEPEEAMDEAMEDDDAMEEDAIEDGSATADEAAADEAEASSPNDPSRPDFDVFTLETSDDLADFGAFAAYPVFDAEAPDDPDIEPAFNTCEAEFADTFTFDVFAGPALFQGEPVIVAVDVDADQPIVVAFTELCEFVSSAPLPPEDVFLANRDS